MKECIVVINQKGGVGKSTTALALGAGLAAKKKKVLFIDLDAQCNMSASLGADTESGTGTMELLAERVGKEQRAGLARECVQHVGFADIIAASPALAAADITISGVGKEQRLKEALAGLMDDYDYVVIDTPPALGILTVNALTAATAAIIPAQADSYSLQGIGQLYDTIGAVQEYTNPWLRVLGIVLTRYSSRAILNREVAESMAEAAKAMGTRLFRTTIRECVSLREAQASRQDIFAYAPKSNAAVDYSNLLKEILKEAAK